MSQAMNFDSINFNPEVKELSIKLNGELVFSPFDLSATAVKLQVYRQEEQLKVLLETAPIGNFSSEKLDLKIKLISENHYAKVLFGSPISDCTTSLGDNEVIAVKDKFHAFWIGADDIRNTLISIPKGLLPMEDRIISFEIIDDSLAFKYHSSISPN